MIDISCWLTEIFRYCGASGVLLVIFLVFFIDAILFPTLPEIFFIVGFMYDPEPIWGLKILVIASIAEAIGISILYYIVENIGVPKKIKNIANKYVDFLVVSDERMLLINRVAPVLLFAGAFVSLIQSWTLKKALLYNFIGCYLKYGVILLFANFFYNYFNDDCAQLYTIIFILAIMILSIIASGIKKRKKGLS